MAYTIHYHESEKVAQQAGEWLTALLQQHADSPILLLLSGGSALQILDHTETPADPKTVTIAVLDERFDADPHINNYLQISETPFFKRLINAGASPIPTVPTSHETGIDCAAGFETALRSWKKEFPGGVVVATQGLGPDGHTSGILPFPEDSEFFDRTFNDPQRWVTYYDAKDKNPYPLRITTTLPFLRDIIDESVLYVTGEGKRSALEAALNPDTPLVATPGAIIQHMKNVTIFTDIQR